MSTLTRRQILTLLAAGGVGGLGYGLLQRFGYAGASTVVRKILRRLHRMPPVPAENERTFAEFPGRGKAVSVEQALNSRCMSDFDGIRIGFHWGLFDPRTKFSAQQTGSVADCARSGHCCEHGSRIRVEDNLIMTVTDRLSSGMEREWGMIESGMQQQAIALTCAALGAGACFLNMGLEGEPVSDTETGTIRVMVSPMLPSYGDSHWTSRAPSGLSGWVPGNLPDPRRDGDIPFVDALKELTLGGPDGREAGSDCISQVLWAARGRTPHLYKSAPWGMTIPTAKGVQGKSKVLVSYDSGLYRYVNWNRHRPTHSLNPIAGVHTGLHAVLKDRLSDFNVFLILTAERPTVDTLWEVGYQLLNILLQASSLGLAYEALLLDEHMKTVLRDQAVGCPAAVVGFRSTPEGAWRHFAS